MAYKNKNIVKDGPFFTHFLSLPFLQPHQRQHILSIQGRTRQLLSGHPKYAPQCLKEHSQNLCHLTLFKLILRHSHTKQQTIKILSGFQEELSSLLHGQPIRFSSINYFTRLNKSTKSRQITVIYLQPEQTLSVLLGKVIDRMLRALLQAQVLVAQQLKDMNVVYDHKSNMYKPQSLHVSLFRCRDVMQDQQFKTIYGQLKQQIKEVLFQCRFADISTMRQYDQTGFYLPLHRFILDKQQ